MIVKSLEALRGTDVDIESDGWSSVRLLLKDDGMGFSFHITTIFAGATLDMHYQNHVEAVYCLSGKGTVEELDNGTVHQVEPGVLYALNKNDRHQLRAETELITVCVFNPPVTGREVHDENGAYPLLGEEAT